MTEQTAGPFMKFPGGKRGLLYRITKLLPAKCNTFYEPFLGGGAVFWMMANEGRFDRAVLSDNNEELIRTWRTIQRNVVGVCRELDAHVHSRTHYEKVRALDPADLSDEKTAARMLYLNSAGFNGMIRYNRAGEFNVPYGKQAKMLIFKSPSRLRACARVLNDHRVDIVAMDFREATKRARPRDAVFYDSPYVPVSKTSSFVGYTRHGFGDEDHSRLAAEFRRLHEKGVPTLLCNSNSGVVRAMYRGFQFETIMVKRAINSVPTKRGAVKEVLVMTPALVAQQAGKGTK